MKASSITSFSSYDQQRARRVEAGEKAAQARNLPLFASTRTVSPGWGLPTTRCTAVS